MSSEAPRAVSRLHLAPIVQVKIVATVATHLPTKISNLWTSVRLLVFLVIRGPPATNSSHVSKFCETVSIAIFTRRSEQCLGSGGILLLCQSSLSFKSMIFSFWVAIQSRFNKITVCLFTTSEPVSSRRSPLLNLSLI